MSPTSTLRQAEISASSNSFYTGNGRSVSRSHKSILTHLKTAGPPAIITATLVTFFVIFIGFGSQLGSQIQDLFTAKTDNSYISYQLKSRRITQQMLNGQRDLPDDFIADLKEQGINIDTDDTGKHVLTFQDHQISASNFDDSIKDNIDFREAFTRAKHGRAINYYDEPAENFFQKLGLSRNIFERYEQTNDSETDTENYHQIINNEYSDSANVSLNTAEDQTSTDEEDGSTTQRTKNGEDITTKNIDGDTPKAKAESYLTSISNKVSATTDTLNLGCAALKVGNLISTAIAAASTFQSIHYFLNNAENLSKAKAGSGNQSAINSVLNFLTEPTTATYTDVATNEEKTITGAPIEAEGAKSILADEIPDKNFVQNFSLTRGAVSTLSALTTNQLAHNACDTAQAAGAVISLATLATGGLVKITVGSLIRNLAGATALQLTISGVLAGLIPMIASTIFQNVAENLTGIPAGEFFASGASASNSASARANSGLAPSSAQTALAYQPAYQTIIAEEAQQIRNTHSPFDASSPYTFLGTISLAFASFSKVPSLSIMTQIASTANNSLNRLVHATGEDSSYLTTFGNCPTLESIGVVGDIYCNPIVTADLSTTDLTPDNPTYQSVITPNLDSSGKIISGSNLGNYIMYCAERESPFGVYDANIAEAFTTSLGPADNLPYLSDVIDILNAAESISAEPWATGSICVNSENNSSWNSEFKYYQHYIEENRILEQMGATTSNPVTAFKKDYYSTHPLDTSRVGTLRRLTGFTAEEAETVLAIFDYASFLATYHPENFLPIEHVEDSNTLLIEHTESNRVAKILFTTDHITPLHMTSEENKSFVINANNDFTPILRNRNFPA